MRPDTYPTMLRKYADMVAKGTADGDLDDVEREYVAAILRQVAAEALPVYYPPSDSTRDETTTLVWTVTDRAQYAIRDTDLTAWHAAKVRAVEITRNV